MSSIFLSISVSGLKCIDVYVVLVPRYLYIPQTSPGTDYIPDEQRMKYTCVARKKKKGGGANTWYSLLYLFNPRSHPWMVNSPDYVLFGGYDISPRYMYILSKLVVTLNRNNAFNQ